MALTTVYELPLGQGRKFLSGTNKALRQVIGGWDLSDICTYQSGAPVDFGDVLLTGNAAGIPLPKFGDSAYNSSDASVRVNHGPDDRP
jgi:hypothetical protein